MKTITTLIIALVILGTQGFGKIDSLATKETKRSRTGQFSVSYPIGSDGWETKDKT